MNNEIGVLQFVFAADIAFESTWDFVSVFSFNTSSCSFLSLISCSFFSYAYLALIAFFSCTRAITRPKYIWQTASATQM